MFWWGVFPKKKSVKWVRSDKNGMKGAACESRQSLWILLGVPERTASLEAWYRTGCVIEIRISCSITMHSNFLVAESMAHVADNFQPLQTYALLLLGWNNRRLLLDFECRLPFEADCVTKVVLPCEHVMYFYKHIISFLSWTVSSSSRYLLKVPFV